MPSGHSMPTTLDATALRSPAPSKSRLKPLVTFARVAARERGMHRAGVREVDTHLLAAEAWLARAHDATADGGVSYGYSIRGGWRPSYPETSGYIATTFLRLANQRHAAYRQRALRILDWLRGIQNEDGSFANPRYGPEGIVFDTGQVLFGLLRGYESTEDPGLLDAAERAADWLTTIAGQDGRWSRNEHLSTPHVYNTRTAWALLRMNEVSFDARRESIARRNLDWALDAQQASGFFDHCAFRAGAAPFTHTIAYATRGLLESGLLLGERRYVEAAERCARATLQRLRPDGRLPSTISIAGEPVAASCCLTGNCQFAIVWALLHRTTGDAAYRSGVERALDFVMSTQDLDTPDADVRGGIKGSHPVWGRYAWLSYPNWATKFFIDAMWLRRGLDG